VNSQGFLHFLGIQQWIVGLGFLVLKSNSKNLIKLFFTIIRKQERIRW